MSIDANRRTAPAFGAQASPKEVEQGPTSRAFCDVIVDSLGRDHALRHTYLRKRWQGFGLDLDVRERRAGAGRPEPMTIPRRPKDEQAV